MRFLLLLLLAASGPGQDLSPEQLRARFEQGKPLWDVKWKLDEKGELWMSPDPVFGDPEGWTPVFRNLARDGIGNLGLFGWLNVFATGPRDLASLSDAELHFSLLGLDTTVEGLRKRVVTPVTERNQALARRGALERILAARLVQVRGIKEARPELEAVVADPNVDPFLRRAAQDALDTFDGEPSIQAAVVSEKVLAALPTDADILFFLDQTRIPPPFFLPRLGRELGVYGAYQSTLMAGGTYSATTLAGGQLLADSSSMVPFEVARRYGNARLDWIVGAFQAKGQPPGAALWVEAQGLFELERIVPSLRQLGVNWEEGKPFRVEEGPFDLNVALDRQRIHIESPGFGKTVEPERAQELRRAGLGMAPIWLHVPSGSRLWQDIDLPVAAKSATVEIRFDGQVSLSLRTDHETKWLAQEMTSLLGGLRQEAEQALQEMGPVPEREKALGILRAATLEVEGEACVLRVEIRGITADDVGALIRRFAML